MGPRLREGKALCRLARLNPNFGANQVPWPVSDRSRARWSPLGAGMSGPQPDPRTARSCMAQGAVRRAVTRSGTRAKERRASDDAGGTGDAYRYD
jgi:hypothetical protein